MAKPKNLYKIFNTKTKKFITTGYKPKSTWHSRHWLLEAVDKIADGHYANIEDIEIHVFPTVEAKKFTYKEMKEGKDEL